MVIKRKLEAIMVIKSKFTVGCTESVQKKYHCDNIIFRQKFLQEYKTLYDNLYHGRIIAGMEEKNTCLVKVENIFVGLLQAGAIKKNIDI